MDAPALDGMGARRKHEWLANWILDPKSTRASVQMPRMLHGVTANADAEAIAAYLGTLRQETVRAPSTPLRVTHPKAVAEISRRSGANAQSTLGEVDEQPADQNQETKPIFERLHCISCHHAPDSPEAGTAKISLKHVAAKFVDGQLAEFLKAPERHYAWIRMPNFKLADSEAKELAQFLLKHCEPVAAKSAPTELSIVARGQSLVQSSGCLNCHAASNLENRFTAPALLTLAKEAKGCLSPERPAGARFPDFRLSAREREALVAFLKTDLASLSRHAPLEFAQREARLLSCAACHGELDHIPALDVLGGKLKPEWAADFIAGVPFKVRADLHPKGELWLAARMPAFRSRATLLAESMAMQQGYAPRTRPEGPVDVEAVGVGHKMIGKDNGLSCISCHAINDLPALEVFESEGTNLGLTGARLLKPYFFRWMRNPLGVDPQTKMPGYFEDGRSALTDYYDGDGEKQINALYQYVRQGEEMAVPATGQ